jgi:hypothetical protein
MPRVAIAVLRSPRARLALVLVVLGLLLIPVLVAAAVSSFIDQSAEASCGEPMISQPAGGGAISTGLYAQPLRLRAGRWYEVGATEYGGPDDPSSGSYGAIPDPTQAYLPAHPDSYAELSTLKSNPANAGSFTFADANALDELPYLTALRVAHNGKQLVLLKRDVGYGQGPGQHIENGEPFRLDLWWQAASTLNVTKSAVQIELAPKTGSAGTLEELPTNENEPAQPPSPACGFDEAAGSVPLPLAAGSQTRILASGLAAAGEEAPAAVKAMVAAGNRLYGTGYLYGGAHGTSLDTLQAAYDCSSAVSYLLHWGGVLGVSALDSGELALYGQPGPGRYVTIYANSAHVFIYVAGLRFDTVEAPEWDSGPNSGKPGARWRVSPTVPNWASWSVRHPTGL